MQFRLRAIFTGACLLLSQTVLAGSSADASFLAARDAFAAGNRQAFERNAAGLQSHVLAPYIDYYRLRLDLERASPDAVAIFLERNADTVVAQRLRADWLRLLAKNEQWADYRIEYARLPPTSPVPEADLRCFALRARLDAADGRRHRPRPVGRGGGRKGTVGGPCPAGNRARPLSARPAARS